MTDAAWGWMRRLGLPALALGLLAGCATVPPVVVLSPRYDHAAVRKVAVAGFSDFRGAAGSGEVAAATFEKYLLLGGYRLIERRQAELLVKEQKLQLTDQLDVESLRKVGKVLGVDALLFGSVTDYSEPREHTVMVTVAQQQSNPMYGSVETVHRDGDTLVRTTQPVVTGYSYTLNDQVVPETRSTPAHVGLSVRLVDVQTGEVLWTASGESEGGYLSGATEEASSRIMRAVMKKVSEE